MDARTFVITGVVVPLVVAVVAEVLAFRWTEWRGPRPHRNGGPSPGDSSGKGSSIVQTVVGPAVGTTQIVDQSTHRTFVNTTHGRGGSHGDEPDDWIVYLVLLCVMIVGVAAAFVYALPWIPVVATATGAALLITCGVAFGLIRSRFPERGRTARKVVAEGILAVTLLHLVVALVPLAPQPKYGTLRGVVENVPRDDFSGTARWFYAEYGWGSTASVAFQALGVAVLVSVFLVTAWTLVRRMVALAWPGSDGPPLPKWLRPPAPHGSLNDIALTLCAWAASVVLALGGGGALGRTLQGTDAPPLSTPAVVDR